MRFKTSEGIRIELDVVSISNFHQLSVSSDSVARSIAMYVFTLATPPKTCAKHPSFLNSKQT